MFQYFVLKFVPEPGDDILPGMKAILGQPLLGGPLFGTVA